MKITRRKAMATGAAAAAIPFVRARRSFGFEGSIGFEGSKGKDSSTWFRMARDEGYLYAAFIGRPAIMAAGRLFSSIVSIIDDPEELSAAPFMEFRDKGLVLADIDTVLKTPALIAEIQAGLVWILADNGENSDEAIRAAKNAVAQKAYWQMLCENPISPFTGSSGWHEYIIDSVENCTELFERVNAHPGLGERLAQLSKNCFVEPNISENFPRLPNEAPLELKQQLCIDANETSPGLRLEIWADRPGMTAREYRRILEIKG